MSNFFFKVKSFCLSLFLFLLGCSSQLQDFEKAINNRISDSLYVDIEEMSDYSKRKYGFDTVGPGDKLLIVDVGRYTKDADDEDALKIAEYLASGNTLVEENNSLISVGYNINMGYLEKNNVYILRKEVIDSDIAIQGRSYKGEKIWRFYIGNKRVQDILGWTEPAEQDGKIVTYVKYVAKVSDRPKWATFVASELNEFKTRPEMEIRLVKTNKGWE